MDFNKRDFMDREERGGIFVKDNLEKMEIINPTIFIHLEEYPAEDLERYCIKLYYSKGIPVDYNKQILIAVDFYLGKYIGEKELKEIEDIRVEKVKRIKEVKEKDIPKFDWDHSENKTKKEGS